MLVEQGYAWYISWRGRGNAPLEAGGQAEKEAREARRGPWAEPNPIPPWEWRKKNKR